MLSQQRWSVPIRVSSNEAVGRQLSVNANAQARQLVNDTVAGSDGRSDFFFGAGKQWIMNRPAASSRANV